MDEIRKIRKKIDKIDIQIQKLLKKRLGFSKIIKKIKNSENLPITDSDRENEILSKLETDYEKEIYKKILSESKK